MVILGEDIPKQLKKNGTLQCYPGMEESDDEDLDVMGESYDIQMGTYFCFLLFYVRAVIKLESELNDSVRDCLQNNFDRI